MSRDNKLPRSEYPRCPRCGGPVAGAMMTSQCVDLAFGTAPRMIYYHPDAISVYCASGSCNWDHKLAELTTPVPASIPARPGAPAASEADTGLLNAARVARSPELREALMMASHHMRLSAGQTTDPMAREALERYAGEVDEVLVATASAAPAGHDMVTVRAEDADAVLELLDRNDIEHPAIARLRATLEGRAV